MRVVRIYREDSRPSNFGKFESNLIFIKVSEFLSRILEISMLYNFSHGLILYFLQPWGEMLNQFDSELALESNFISGTDAAEHCNKANSFAPLRD